jgi:predicted 3-demethylubiquinone-9 3-methyltransferase (glyoxalase superfamily)
MQKITPFLWFDRNAEEAINFYTSTFANSKIVSMTRYPESGLEGPMQGFEGKVLTGVFELENFRFMCLDGGPIFKFNPSVSFAVTCSTAEDTQALFKKLTEGGSVMMELQEYPFSKMYGWGNDKYGVSWQVSVARGGETQLVIPSLMFVGKNFGKVDEALDFYTSVFKNSTKDFIMRYEAGEGDQEGKVKYSVFILDGQKFSAMESSLDHKFEPNEAVSFYVECEDQAEVDYYWDKLSAIPASEQCGWLKDKYGFSWQIIPKALPKLMSDPDPEKSKRVTHAMLQMKKIVIADLEKAANG